MEKNYRVSPEILKACEDSFNRIDFSAAYHISKRTRIPVKTLKKLKDNNDFDGFMEIMYLKMQEIAEEIVARNTSGLSAKRLKEIEQFYENNCKGGAMPTYEEWFTMLTAQGIESSEDGKVILKNLYNLEVFDNEPVPFDWDGCMKLCEEELAAKKN